MTSIDYISFMLSSDSSNIELPPGSLKAPFAYAQITLSKADYIELKAQAKQCAANGNEPERGSRRRLTESNR